MMKNIKNVLIIMAVVFVVGFLVLGLGIDLSLAAIVCTGIGLILVGFIGIMCAILVIDANI